MRKTKAKHLAQFLTIAPLAGNGCLGDVREAPETISRDELAEQQAEEMKQPGRVEPRAETVSAPVREPEPERRKRPKAEAVHLANAGAAFMREL